MSQDLVNAVNRALSSSAYQCYTKSVSDENGWNVDCCYLDGSLVSDLNLWHLSGFSRRFVSVFDLFETYGFYLFLFQVWRYRITKLSYK